MDRLLPTRWRAEGWLFGAILFLYWFSTSSARPWGDATPVWEVADSIVQSHNLHAKTRWPGTLPNGKDGHLYGLAPLLQSLVHVPGAALQRKISTEFPSYWQIAWRFTSHLATTMLGAFGCVLFFGLCRRIGIRPWPAALTTLALGFASSVWVYSRYPYSETLQMVCFTGMFCKMLDVREQPTWRHATMLGVWAGLLVNAKPVFLLSCFGVGLFIAWSLRRNWRALALVTVATCASAIPLGALYLWYNYARWGSVTFTGYGLAISSSGISTGPGLHESALVGLWGMLASPGKSIFLYSPPLFLSLFAIHRFARRFPHLVLAMVLTILPGLLIHAQMISWAGDYAWGSRYTIFALPVLFLPAAFLLDDWLGRLVSWRRWFAVATLSGVFLAGLGVTYLGNAIYWDHFIRVQYEATQTWLGVPNNKGDGISTGTAPCPVCFETLYPLHWLPPFQHIVGNYWLLSHVPRKHSWVTAEKDAPWRRYTNLQLNIEQSYGRARVDWWFVEYRKDFPRLVWTLVIVFPTLSLAALLLFFWEIRRAARRVAAALRESPEVPAAVAELGV
jgi:hypothetical protein